MMMIFIQAIMIATAIVIITDFTPRYRRGATDKDLTIVVPIAKTVYKVAGHFSKNSKMTAKKKIERLIKKEIQK